MDGIVLLAKKPGLTSFASLSNIKKALHTTKVGHTGTLDSFAQGLLVVCTGRLTRLAGNITEFDKAYSAVIKFGEETDTLDYTGNIIKKTSLPTKEKVEQTVLKFVGEQMQRPPIFSAIHVNGKRASSLARGGVEAEIPERRITVYAAEIRDMKLNNEGLVEACLVDFTVSKGTYIRSLARDIGNACGSAGFLIGLFRTRLGNFKIEDAAGFNELEDFTISNCIKTASSYNKENPEAVFYGDDIQNQILNKIQKFTKELSLFCGFINIELVDEQALAEFKNGKPLKNKLFVEDLYNISSNSIIAVFQNKEFYGLLEKDLTGKIRYKFVIN